MIEPVEAAHLIRAVARDNMFARGRKSRMEAWKVMFGVYVSARYKHPTYTLAGVRWKLHYSLGFSRHGRDGRTVRLPSPNIYMKSEKEVPLQDFIMTFTSFEGCEESFKKDFTMLRMFESEWAGVPGRSTGE